MIKNLKEKTKHAQKIRNKKIGHNDFNTKTNKSKIENKYTREEITEIISIIYEIINLISENICESSIHDSVNRGAGTELTILINLYLGQKQIEENRATRDWRNNPLRDLPDWLKN